MSAMDGRTVLPDRSWAEERLRSQGTLLCRTQGESMSPTLHHHDLVRVSLPERPLRRGDVILYRRGRLYLLHRIVRMLPEGCLVRGDAQEQEEFVENERILGRMTALIRKGREIPV